MALAFDAIAGADDFSGSATSLTYAHTCTGANRLLVVTVALVGATDDVTGVTYNGVALTRIGFVGNAGTQACASFLYYLIAPASGANNVVISVSPGQNISGRSVSYTGAKQTGQPDSSATNNTSTGTTLALTTTVVATGSWLASSYFNLNGRTIPVGTSDRGGSMLADSNGTVSTGSNTQTWTTDTSGSAQVGVIASIAPAIDSVSVSVSDNINVSESTTLQKRLLINTFDSVAVSENVHPTRGPIDFDAASSSAYQASLSSYSWSHTTSGTNRLLIVGVSIFAIGTVTSVTYNGTNLSFLRSDTNGLLRCGLWWLQHLDQILFKLIYPLL